MRIIWPGHTYEVEEYDNPYPQPDDKLQQIRFMHRVGDGYPGNEGIEHSGTNSQELIRVLIDRTKYLHNQIPAAENRGIIENLRTALLLYELRAARRHGRELLWKELPIEFWPTYKDGHVR